ncbi:MAG: Flp family type IVb pilin [Tepidisphaeraceae bacterium]
MLKSALKKIARDEDGGEVIEYALIAGLIVAGCIAVLGRFGTKVLARWNSVNSSI